MDFILTMKCYLNIYGSIILKLFGLYMIAGHLQDIARTMNLMDVMDGKLVAKRVDLKTFIHIVFYRTQ